MLYEKIERWTFLLLMIFLIVATIIPNYALIFLSITIVLALVKQSLAIERERIKKAVIAIGVCMFCFFMGIPVSENIYGSLRQYVLLLHSLIPFFICILLRLSMKDVVKASIMLSRVVLAFILIQFIPASVHGVLYKFQDTIHVQEFMIIMAGNLVNLFPLFFVISISNISLTLMERVSLTLSLAGIILLLWWSGATAHLLPVVVMLVTWSTLVLFSEKKYYDKTAWSLAGILLILSVGLLIYHNFIFQLLESIVAMYSQTQLWTAFMNKPVLGYGLDAVSNFYYQYANTGIISLQHLYSGLINITLETGGVGLAGVLFMFYRLFRDNYVNWRTSNNIWCLLALLLLTGFFAELVMFHYFIIPAVMAIFCFVIGLAYVSTLPVTKGNENE